MYSSGCPKHHGSLISQLTHQAAERAGLSELECLDCQIARGTDSRQNIKLEQGNAMRARRVVRIGMPGLSECPGNRFTAKNHKRGNAMRVAAGSSVTKITFLYVED
ncbi:hypothetical protein FRX31_008051 [Thalictrum thalictroides]|uniref:Uncharacterized protein n=1 Tax=Thalictrum thalictroides TaxID=46969 RepID=A0A7J6X0R6_THATH|nr:hypothetical protein FRX31_008051 [Thalictrum thalictroides]